MDFLSPIIQSEQFDTLRGAFRPNGTAALFGVQPIHQVLYAAGNQKPRSGKPIRAVNCNTQTAPPFPSSHFGNVLRKNQLPQGLR